MVEMEDAMKRWIKRGICALTLGAMLSANVLAAELSLSFDKQGTTAAVELRDVGTDRYAAEVTMDITNAQTVQFQGKGDTYAVTVDSVAGTVTLYVASRTPLTAADGTLDLGTLTVADGTQVTGVPKATVLDRFLNGTKYETVELSVTHTSSGGSSSDGSSSGGSSSTVEDRTPTVSVNGSGGKVHAASDGTVTITPDEGYRIAKILVNGREVTVSTRLTGLKATDTVVVTFEREEEPEETPEENPKPVHTFTDVGSDDWYAEAVNYAVSNGLFLGISETEFGPNVSMSRAMLVTVLHRMAGAPNAGTANFADVPADAWYTQAVAWAAANGIVQGVSDSRFAPNVPVTREQMATILYRYANHAGVAGDGGSGSLDSFRDASAVSGYAVQAMGWAVDRGLISGVGDQRLSPGGSATRAQVAAILQRFAENIQS